MKRKNVTIISKSFRPYYFTPLGIANIKSYAQQFKAITDNFNITLYPLYSKDTIISVLSHFAKTEIPEIICFSNYGWNYYFNLNLAQTLKEYNKNILTVFGGPHVSYRADEILARESSIDIIVNGEGEKTFKNLLMSLIDNGDFTNVPGISFLKDHHLIENSNNQAITDLNQIPSPYFNGILDTDIIGRDCSSVSVLETTRGCAFQCAFCGGWADKSRGKIIRHFALERSKEEITLIGKSKGNSIYLTDSNFGMFKKDLELVKHVVDTNKKYGYPKRFITCWSKIKNDNLIEIAHILQSAGIDCPFSVSFQSTNKNVLNLSQRKCEEENIENFIDKCKEKNISTYAELIWGLPGENLQSFYDGYNKVRTTVSQVSIYPLYILPNSHFYRNKKEFNIISSKLFLDQDWEIALQSFSYNIQDHLEGMAFICSHLILQSLQINPILDLINIHYKISYTTITSIFREYIENVPNKFHNVFPKLNINQKLNESYDPYYICGNNIGPLLMNPKLGDEFILEFIEILLLKECSLSIKEIPDYMREFINYILIKRPLIEDNELDNPFESSISILENQNKIFKFSFDVIEMENKLKNRILDTSINPKANNFYISINYPANAKKSIPLFQTAGMLFIGRAKAIEEEYYNLINSLDGAKTIDENF
ncbi:MAG: B12-binding domain-containing radical SAM protein, partial [Oligoflexia bacterium]|nr:B12-binding domain-containing radical SAM protein [Oligoflexia bacterium]